jgi:hypothetical protein
MNGSISFPNSSINSGAIDGLDDKIDNKITNATSNIKTYSISNMRDDLRAVSNGENGLFTWNDNGETITGLNANYINVGAIDASLITTGELDGRLIKAESLKADSIGAGTLRVTVGIKHGFDLIGDKSRGASVSDDPRKWQTFGHLTVETGEA